MKYVAAAALAMLLCSTAAMASDFRLSVVDSGLRDYYCTTTVRLENLSDSSLDDLNGFVLLLAGDEVLGQSRSSSFFGLGPGEVGDVTFDTPSAPCADVNGYRFVVGACRIDQSFQDRADCAGRLETLTPIHEAVAR